MRHRVVLSFYKVSIFLLGLIFLGLVACNGEVSEEQNTSKEFSKEPLPGFVSDLNQSDCFGVNCRFQKIAGKEELGFDVFLDSRTFRFSEPRGQKAYELKKNDLKKIYNWRSKKGIPWTAWAYGTDSDFKSHEAFSIFSVTGAYFIDDAVLERVIRFLAQEKGLEPVEKIVSVLTYKEMFFEDPLLQYPEKLNHKLSGWFRENVAALSDNLYVGISETFAWYISPGYKKGNLPPEMEAAMEMIKRTKVQDSGWRSQEEKEVVERAAKIIQTRSLPPIDPPFYASNFDLMLLQLDKNVQALGFYRNLISVLKYLKRNPENFSKVELQFEKLLEAEPEANTGVYINWGKGLRRDLLLLEESKNLPETQILKTERLGEVSKYVLRESLATEITTILDSLTAYVKKWSEFE